MAGIISNKYDLKFLYITKDVKIDIAKLITLNKNPQKNANDVNIILYHNSITIITATVNTEANNLYFDFLYILSEIIHPKAPPKSAITVIYVIINAANGNAPFGSSIQLYRYRLPELNITTILTITNNIAITVGIIKLLPRKHGIMLLQLIFCFLFFFIIHL